MASVTWDSTLQITEEQHAVLSALVCVSSLHLFKRLSGGYSGAAVFLAIAHGPKGEYLGTRVVKTEVLKTLSKDLDEADRHTAVQVTPMLGHVPTLFGFAREGQARAYVYDIAGKTLTNSHDFGYVVKNRYEGARIAARKVAAALLAWNTDSSISTVSPYDTVRSTVEQYRFDGPNGIQSIASKLGAPESKSLLRFSGDEQAVPNPVAYGSRRSLWGKVGTLPTPWGRTHGDLHPGNIIVVQNGGGSWEPFIIDFAQYAPKRHQFFDLAYLELSLLLSQLDPDLQANRRIWTRICSYLSSGLNVSSDGFPDGAGALALVIPELRLAAVSESLRCNETDHFVTTYGLAAVAASLNYFRKLSTDWGKKAALLFGAYHLSAVLKRLGIEYASALSIDVQWSPPSGPVAVEIENEKLRAEVVAQTVQPGIIMVLGPNWGTEVGVPSAREVSQKIAKSDTRIPPTASPHDPMWFDAVFGTATRSYGLDHMKAEIGAICASVTVDTAVIDVFARVPWLAVVDWNLSSKIYHSIKATSAISWQRVYLPQISKLSPDDISKIGLRSGSKVWASIRGDDDNPSLYRLSTSEWIDPDFAQSRSRFYKRLSDTGHEGMSVVMVGWPTELVQSMLTELRAGFGTRTPIWVVGEGLEPLRPYLEFTGAHVVDASPRQVIDVYHEALPQFPLSRAAQGGFRCTVMLTPKDSDEVEQQLRTLVIEESFVKSIQANLEILHDGIGDEPGPTEPGAFYRGYPISWSEIHNRFAVERDKGSSLYETLATELGRGTLARVRLDADPGAGATTLAHQIAWKLFTQDHAPVIRIKAYHPEIVEALDYLREQFRRSMLVIADHDAISLEESDSLFEDLISRQIPVVMLQVGRARREQVTIGPRHLFLEDQLSPKEYRDVMDKLRPYLPPQKWAVLNGRNGAHSLFMTLLEAFESEFKGLPKFVRSLLEGLEEEQLQLAAMVAFFHRYATPAVPASLLASASGFDGTIRRLGQAIEPFLDRLVLVRGLDTPDPIYQCRHELLARQILLDLWGTDGTSDVPWASILATKAAEAVDRLHPGGPGYQAKHNFVMRLIVGDYSTVQVRLARKTRDVDCSRLIGEIPDVDMREEVFAAAGRAFPMDAHILAHYGKFLYDHRTDRFDDATRLLADCEELRNWDPKIVHMHGMCHFREMEYLIDRTPIWERSSSENERILELLRQAGDCFERARSLDRTDVTGYSSHVDAILAFVSDQARLSREGNSLADKIAQRQDLQEWLDYAFGIWHEAEDNIGFELDETMLRLRNRLDRMWGDMQQVVSRCERGIREHTGQPEQQQVFRRQMASCCYSMGRAAGVLTDLAQAHFRKGRESLEAVVRANPTDVGTISAWFRSARLDKTTDREVLMRRLKDFLRYSDNKLLGTYYLMCYSFIEFVAEKDLDAWHQYETYRATLKEKVRWDPYRTAIRDWIARDLVLLPDALVDRPDEKSRSERDTSLLFRLEGKVAKVDEYVGYTSIVPPFNKQIHFKPRRAGLKVFSYQVDTPVSLFVAFTLEGVVGYNVTPLTKDAKGQGQAKPR